MPPTGIRDENEFHSRHYLAKIFSRRHPSRIRALGASAPKPPVYPMGQTPRPARRFKNQGPTPVPPNHPLRQPVVFCT